MRLLFVAVLLCLLPACSGTAPSNPPETPVGAEISFEQALLTRQQELEKATNEVKRLPELTRRLEQLKAKHRTLLEQSGSLPRGDAYQTLVSEGARTVQLEDAIGPPERIDYGAFSEDQRARLEAVDRQQKRLLAVLPTVYEREREVRWLERDIERLGGS